MKILFILSAVIIGLFGIYYTIKGGENKIAKPKVWFLGLTMLGFSFGYMLFAINNL